MHKHIIAVFRKHSLTCQNLPQYYKSSPPFTIDDNLILPQKHIHSVEDTQISDATNKKYEKACLMIATKTDLFFISQKITPQREPQLQFVESC